MSDLYISMKAMAEQLIRVSKILMEEEAKSPKWPEGNEIIKESDVASPIDDALVTGTGADMPVHEMLKGERKVEPPKCHHRVHIGNIEHCTYKNRAAVVVTESDIKDSPLCDYKECPRPTLNDEDDLTVAPKSIASIENWILFSDAAETHIVSTQVEKYATDRNLQVIDAVLGTMKSKKEKLGYLLGTARVMLCRYGNKSDREGRTYDDLDLLKAAHYIAMAWSLDR